MKAFHFIPVICFAFLFFIIENLPAQQCEYWSVPQPVSDSITNNHNATLVMLSGNPTAYYVFWERTFEDSWSEIVCANYYETAEPQVIIHANSFDVNNPQVIAVSDYPDRDTLAFVFYIYTYMEGYRDIFYQVMTDTGFSGSTRFTNTILNESHLRVSPGGGMVWQEGDKIRFSRLNWASSGFYFEPVVTIDSGDCRNPDIQNTEMYNSTEGFIAWEKGDPDNPEIWFSAWSFENEAWSEPMLLFGDGNHSGIRFSIGTDIASWVPMLLSDLNDESGKYRISGFDFIDQTEFITEFSQEAPFQPSLLTIDFITDYWQMGYLAFRHGEGEGNSDIYSSDYGWLEPYPESFCSIDSTDQPDVNPQLFQGAWHFDYFDLVCIWETFRNGHWQLFSATTPVVIGNIPEIKQEGDLKANAYPNPFKDCLMLEYQSGGTSAISISVYNTIGQLVKTIACAPSSSEKSLKEIDMNDLPSGIYFFKLFDGHSAFSLKAVKK
jgi:hypothetical protein